MSNKDMREKQVDFEISHNVTNEFLKTQMPLFLFSILNLTKGFFILILIVKV
jgi:hypothetical protein